MELVCLNSILVIICYEVKNIMVFSSMRHGVAFFRGSLIFVNETTIVQVSVVNFTRHLLRCRRFSATIGNGSVTGETRNRNIL